MNKADQLYIMNAALLECAVYHNMRTDDLYIHYKEDTKTWYLIERTTEKIMFKKTWIKPKKIKTEKNK